MQADIDVALQGVGVETNLMLGGQERLCLCFRQADDVCIEIDIKPKAVRRQRIWASWQPELREDLAHLIGF